MAVLYYARTLFNLPELFITYCIGCCGGCHKIFDKEGVTGHVPPTFKFVQVLVPGKILDPVCPLPDHKDNRVGIIADTEFQMYDGPPWLKAIEYIDCEVDDCPVENG